MNPLFIVCLILRALLAILALLARKTSHLQTMGALALIPAAGFSVIYLFDLRKSGVENKVIWWNDFRPFHAALYFLFALHAIKRHADSWKFLAADALLGAVAWGWRYIY